jgi:type I restriction enzyme, S subunit
VKLKQVCSLSADYGLNISADSYVDGGIPMIRTSDFDDMGRLALSEAKAVSLSDAHDKLLENGDILFSRSGTVGRCMVFEETKPCTFAAYLVRFRPRLTQAHPKFIFYWAQSKWFRHQVSVETIESTIGNFNGAKFASLEFPQLSVGEQKAIADFLDRETARIDQLIEKKDRQYLALEEDHQAIVTTAVTIGLDPAPMSPTANTWLKEIPAHWDLSRLKFVCERIVDCVHETPEHSESGDYPSIRTADLIRGRLLLDQAKRVSEDDYCTRIQRLEPAEGDILYTREGARFGLAALVPPGLKLCLGQRMMLFRTNRRVLPAFLMWSLNGQFAYNWLKQSISGAASPHLNIYDIRNVPLPLPPLAEQQLIVNRIDMRFRRKEAASEAISSSIERLQERRSALITAAVTGQIDVATWGKRGTTDRRLDAMEADMAAAAQPERQQARA